MLLPNLRIIGWNRGILRYIAFHQRDLADKFGIASDLAWRMVEMFFKNMVKVRNGLKPAQGRNFENRFIRGRQILQ